MAGVAEGDTLCAQCQLPLAEGQDREATAEGVFCRPCFESLTAQLDRVVREQTSDINYPAALTGGILGGALGVAVWWGFTVLTGIAFGLVAVVIGIAVGKGIVLFARNKRSRGLQAASVVLAALAFLYASYLVHRTYIQQAFAKQGQTIVLPMLPDAPMFFNVVKAGFQLFDVVFLAFVIYQAWKIPAPFKLGR